MRHRFIYDLFSHVGEPGYALPLFAIIALFVYGITRRRAKQPLRERDKLYIVLLGLAGISVLFQFIRWLFTPED